MENQGGANALYSPTDPTQLVVVTPGKYLIDVEFGMLANTVGQRTVQLKVNSIVIGKDSDLGKPINTHLKIHRKRSLQPGDVITVEVWQNAGIPVAVGRGWPGHEYSPILSAELLHGN